MRREPHTPSFRAIGIVNQHGLNATAQVYAVFPFPAPGEEVIVDGERFKLMAVEYLSAPTDISDSVLLFRMKPQQRVQINNPRPAGARKTRPKDRSVGAAGYDF